jgi:hypothetical protein
MGRFFTKMAMGIKFCGFKNNFIFACAELLLKHEMNVALTQKWMMRHVRVVGIGTSQITICKLYKH